MSEKSLPDTNLLGSRDLLGLGRLRLLHMLSASCLVDRGQDGIL